MSARVKKLLKVTLTLVLLAVVLMRIDLHALRRAFADLTVMEVFALLVLVCLQQVLLTQRFATVLASLGGHDAHGRTQRLADLLIDQQVGTAYNVVLPSTVGGDVIRALRAQRRLGDVKTATVWSAVLLDRLVGLLALALVPLFGLMLGAGQGSNLLLRTTAAVTLCLLPLVLFASSLFRLFARLTRGRIERLHHLAVEVADVLDAGRPGTRWVALFWSLVYLVAVNAFFHVATYAFGIPLAVAIPAIWVGLPLAFVLSILPVTIGGLGLRESLFVGILGLFGISAEPALALSLLWGAQGIATALAGVIALWSERAPRSEAPAA